CTRSTNKTPTLSSVAAWLASTARKCGYPADLLSGASKSKGPGGRPKGKARKDAKKQQQASQSGTSAPKYIIAIKDFIPLAEYIISSTKPLISVPGSFAETIDRVIYTRFKFGDKMQKRGMERDDMSDESHNYFVGVLESVRGILRPRMPVETPASVSIEDLTNRFSGLNVYEPSQEFIDAPDLVRPEKVQGDDNNYEAEVSQSFDDTFMACAVLAKELYSLRYHITSTWVAFAAIDLARSLMDQVFPIFESRHGSTKLMHTCAFFQALAAGFAEEEIAAWGGPEDGNEGLYDVGNEFFLNTIILLQSLEYTVGPKQIMFYKEGMFGTYDPKSDWSRKDGNAKLKEDKVILGEFFLEAVMLTRAVDVYPVQDEFLRGVREMDKTGKMPFYLVFAAQVLLDIHHFMRGGTGLAFEALSRNIDGMRADLHQQMDYNKEVKPVNRSATNERALRELEGKMRYIEEDPIFRAKQKLARKDGDLPAETQKHRIVILSSILSGLLINHFRAGIYELGITVMNCWGSVTASAHLYNALGSEGLIESDSWGDMEIVQSFLGISNFFVDWVLGFCHLQQWESVEHETDAGVIQMYSACDPKGRERRNQRKKATEGGKVKAEELLVPLASALTGELTEFGFPYMYMHHMTWEILNTIKSACDPILRRLNGPAYLENENQLPLIVGYIFDALYQDPEGDGKELMRTAAEVFKRVMQKGIGGGAKIKFCELNTSMSIKHNSELYGESHKRYHERHGGKPAEDCAWDCGWHADWENDDEKEKEKEDDKDS
ncbi:hypothetical protein FIE12Z_4893, partial [Fusarium flagelliforme]